MKLTRLILLLCCLPMLSMAQDAIEFNNAIVVEQAMVTAKNLEYVSYSVHSKDFNEIDRKRKEITTQIDASIKAVTALTAPERGADLKKEALEVLGMYKRIFDMDFVEVAKLKQDSESSYDAMERYFEAQQKAEKQLDKAGDRFNRAQERFAKRNDFKIEKSDGTDPLSKQIKKMNRANEYTRKIFLTYFKADKAHGAFMEAMSKQEKGLEGKRSKMEKAAKEALGVLKEMDGFEGDKDYLNATVKLMTFYKNIAANEFVDVVKVATAKQEDLTQKDVDNYNNGIQKYNNGVNALIMDFNQKYSELLKKHVPNVGVPKNKVQRL
ncbi:MAG: LIC11966 family surface protein [Saprospiraceae bacterium]